MQQQSITKYFQTQQAGALLYRYPTLSMAQKNVLDKFNGSQSLEQIFDLVQTLNQAKNIENFKSSVIQLQEAPRALFITKSLTKMAQMSKNLFTHLPKQINILDGGTKHVQLNREQIYTLCSLAFFGLLQNDSQGNFSDLMSKRERDPKNDRKIAKLQCLIHYFNETRVDPQEIVTFSRITFDPQYHCKVFFQAKSNKLTKDLWLNSNIMLTKVNLTWKQKIEDFDDAIMVDFADQYIGGGVLRTGLVQEEIMLITHPESLVALMFTHKLETDDALIISNVRNHSEYTGYANTFKCISSGNLKPKHILAIDALNYSRYPQSQYDEFNVLRDLNKCFIGFSQWKGSPLMQKNICTGNWGCGIFKGDVELKFLLQWMAFSQVQINQPQGNLIYCAFEESKFHKIGNLIEKYQGKTIGEIAQVVFSYGG